MPTFSDDDVIDYMVREAIVTRVAHEENAAKPVKEILEEANQHHSDHKQWAKEMGLTA